MTKITKMVAALIFVTSSAHAFDFKGVTIGGKSTPDEITRTLGVECGIGAEDMQVCNGEVTIAAEPASMNLVISKSGIVQRINLMMTPDSFDEVAPELIKKFGTPNTYRSIVQNRMNAKYSQVIYTWGGKSGVRVVGTRYYGSLDKANIYFSTKSDRAIMMPKVNRSGDI